jgi:hypothetical protein
MTSRKSLSGGITEDHLSSTQRPAANEQRVIEIIKPFSLNKTSEQRVESPL